MAIERVAIQITADDKQARKALVSLGKIKDEIIQSKNIIGIDSTRITEVIREIGSLRDSLDGLNSANVEIGSNINEKSQELASFVSQVDDLDMTTIRLEAEVEDVGREIAQLNKQIEDMSWNSIRMDAEIEDGAREIAKLSKQVEDLTAASHMINIDADTVDASKNIANLSQQITNINNEVGGGIKDWAGFSLVQRGVNEGFNMITGSIGRAANRFDTVNNFAEVMGHLGVEARVAHGAMDNLLEGLVGLPTALDDMIPHVTTLFGTLRDLDYSVDTVHAFNNAMLASQMPLQQHAGTWRNFNQAVQTGNWNMQTWYMTFGRMPVALQMLESHFGKTGDEIRNALNNGMISTYEFLDALQDLNNYGTGHFSSFEEIARSSTAGIMTGFSNMRLSAYRGTTAIIGAIDEVISRSNFDGIYDVLGMFGNVMQTGLEGVATMISENGDGVVDFFNRMYYSIRNFDFEAFFTGFASGFGVAIDALRTVQVVGAPALSFIGDMVTILGGGDFARGVGLLIGLAGGFKLLKFSLGPLIGIFKALGAIKLGGIFGAIFGGKTLVGGAALGGLAAKMKPLIAIAGSIAAVAGAFTAIGLMMQEIQSLDLNVGRLNHNIFAIGAGMTQISLWGMLNKFGAKLSLLGNLVGLLNTGAFTLIGLMLREIQNLGLDRSVLTEQINSIGGAMFAVSLWGSLNSFAGVLGLLGNLVGTFNTFLFREIGDMLLDIQSIGLDRAQLMEQVNSIGYALTAISAWGTLSGLVGAIGGLLAGLTTRNIDLFREAMEFFIVLAQVDYNTLETAGQNVHVIGELLNVITESLSMDIVELFGHVMGTIGTVFSNIQLNQLLAISEVLTELSRFDASIMDDAEYNVTKLQQFLSSFNTTGEDAWETLGIAFEKAINVIGSIAESLHANATASALRAYVDIAVALGEIAQLDMSSTYNTAKEQIGKIRDVMECIRSGEDFWTTLVDVFTSFLEVGVARNTLRLVDEFIEMERKLYEFVNSAYGFDRDSVVGIISDINHVLEYLRGENDFWGTLGEVFTSWFEVGIARNTNNIIDEFYEIKQKLFEFSQSGYNFESQDVIPIIDAVKEVLGHLESDQGFFAALGSMFTSWFESNTASNTSEMVDEFKTIILSFQEIDALGYRSSTNTTMAIDAVELATERLEEFADARGGISGAIAVINHIIDAVNAFQGLITSLTELTPDFRATGYNYAIEMIEGFDDAQVNYNITNYINETLESLYGVSHRFTETGDLYGTGLATAFRLAIAAMTGYMSSVIDGLGNSFMTMRARTVGTTLGSAIVNGFNSVVVGLATSMSTQISNIQANLNTLRVPSLTGTVSMSNVSSVRGFSSGGYVGFPKRIGTDTVPAMLTAGEFVMRKRAVDQYGSSFLDMLNRGDTSSIFENLLPRFTTQDFAYPSVSSIVNNYNDNSNNSNHNSNNVTFNATTNNPDYLLSSVERWL